MCATRRRAAGTRKPKHYSYYYCQTPHKPTPVKCEQTKYFRSELVDAAVWEWIESWLSEPERLAAGLDHRREEQEAQNAPVHERMAVIKDLLTDNRTQLERLLDLYLSGEFSRDILTERRKRLETNIAVLDRELATLAAAIETQTLSDDEMESLQGFAQQISPG